MLLSYPCICEKHSLWVVSIDVLKCYVMSISLDDSAFMKDLALSVPTRYCILIKSKRENKVVQDASEVDTLDEELRE